MYWPFTIAFAKLENELRIRLGERDSRIAELTEERDQLRAKVERMELVLMPLTSQSGAAYVRLLNPSREGFSSHLKASPVGMPQSSWQTYLNEYIKKMEDQEKKDGVQ